MTRVYCEKNGNWYTVTAKGHATGSQEVCAAVSSLLYALAGYVKNEKKSLSSAEWSIDSGDVFVLFRGGEKARAVFDMTVIGLLQIEKSHPEYIRVERMEIF